MSNDLHIYLKTRPPLPEMTTLLKLFGYSPTRSFKANNMVEPDCHYWEWTQTPLSGSGFQLLYFDGMFRDNQNTDKYDAFVVLESNAASSDFDVSMIDITAALLLRRYGGTLHNPQRLDRKFPNVFLCGKNNPKT